MNLTNLVSRLAAALGVLVLAAALFVWTFCRVDVAHDECLVLIRKSGKPLAAGEVIAGPGFKGIQRETLGPGRYFFNPLVWDWERFPLTRIDPGDPSTWRTHYASAGGDTAAPELLGKLPQVGIVTNKVGKPAPGGAEVVDEGFKGIQKAVLTPGEYRINPYVYDVKPVPAVVVPTGHAGVVISQIGDMPETELIVEKLVGPDGSITEGKPMRVQKLARPGQRGVVEDVLQPGVYYLNPKLYTVELVQVGYNQVSQARTPDMTTHITFPSKDGFTIDVEITVVWGRHPAHVAEMINRFGDIDKMKQIIIGQMRSICRNLGSEYESTDFIRGEKRERYQRDVTETLRKACRERDIDILIALIHDIAVHGSAQSEKEGIDLKTTIQRGFVAREQDLTKQSQRETAKFRAQLETAKVAVEVARESVAADTRKKAAEIAAEGDKQAQELDAQRDLEVATIEREIAELEAGTTRTLGKATAQVEQLKQQAEADGKRMLIEAFGTGRAFNLYTFAETFDPESIRLIFAGEGTFWTDLNRMQDAAAVEMLKQK